MDVSKRERLILDHLYIPKEIVGAIFRRSHDLSREDLVQIGYLTIVRCADRWNPSIGDFIPYVKRAVFREMINGLRDYKKHTLDCKDGDGVIFERASVEELFNTTEDIRQIPRWVKKLPKKYRRVIEEKYGLNDSQYKTNRHVATSIGVLDETVRKRLEKAIYKLSKIAT